MTNLNIVSIKSKINAIENYNGQLSTIQARTQESFTLIRFSFDNDLISETEAKELVELLEVTYNKAISTATFNKIIQF